MKNYFYKILAAICLSTTLASCAREISSDVYVAKNVGEASTTYIGTIMNVRQVLVEEGESLGDNQTGIIGGATAGGFLGNACGNKLFPTVLGAAAGAIGGAVIEKKLKQQTALEYIVEIENGGLMTIVQGTDCCFNIGQPVYVIVNPCGRSRIISR